MGGLGLRAPALFFLLDRSLFGCLLFETLDHREFLDAAEFGVARQPFQVLDKVLRGTVILGCGNQLLFLSRKLNAL